MLADQRRLVAPGEAVDDTGGLRIAGEQRPRHRVGLDIDHDDVLAVRDRALREADAGLGIAGRLDDHLDAGMRDQAFGVVGDVGPAALMGVVERRRRERRVVPAGGLELALRPRNREIGKAYEMHAARAPDLGEEHGAELAGADQPDRHRPAGSLAREQHGVKVHREPAY